MVGSGDPLDAALKVALDRRGLFVEAVALESLRQAVHLTAPDLILLVGDAAAEGGEAALATLSGDPSTAAVPVALLAPDEKLESRMHAFRHGAMAVVPRTASADGVARQVTELSKEMSTHFEEKTGEIGEATFDELVELVKQELRSGILSVHAPGHQGGPMRVVLGAGRPVAQAVQEFVARLRPHVAAAEPMYYQFHTSAGGPVELLDADASAAADLQVLERLRLLLVDDDPARADTLAQELRARGALVFVTDTAGRGLERAVGLDPQVAIVDAAGLEGPGFEVVRSIRKDLRLRWASILVAPWDEIWPEDAPTPDMEQLAARIEPLLAPEEDLAKRAAEEEAFDVRLESTGPSRMLRILVQSGNTLHLTVRNPRAVIDLDLAQNLLVGAEARPAEGEQLEGTAALATLLALGSGRVHVERRTNPTVANVMTPVDEALSAASAEPPRVTPSAPPDRTPNAAAKVEGPPKGADAGFVPLEEDDEPDQATEIKDLSKLAHAGEVLLDDVETVRPPEPPVDPKESVPSAFPPAERGPIAANERRRPRQKRKATLVMGAPAIPPPVGEADGPGPAAEPDPEAPKPEKRARRKKTLVGGLQAGGGAQPSGGGRAAEAARPPGAGADAGPPPPPAGAPDAAAPATGATGTPGSTEAGAAGASRGTAAGAHAQEVRGAAAPGAGAPGALAQEARGAAAPGAGAHAQEARGAAAPGAGAPGALAQEAAATESAGAPSAAARDGSGTPDAGLRSPGSEAAPSFEAQRAAAREPTGPVDTGAARRGGSGTLGKVALASAALALVAVLALVGYRFSGLRVAPLDRALALVGAAPGAPASGAGSGAGAGSPTSAQDSAASGPAEGPNAEAPQVGAPLGGGGADEPAVAEENDEDAADGDGAEAAEGADEPAVAEGSDEAGADGAADGADEPAVAEGSDEAGADGAADGAAEGADPVEGGDGAAVEGAEPTEAADARTAAASEGGADGDAEGEDEDDDDLAAIDDPEELVARARRAGNSDLAERLYRRALRLDPREHHAMVGLARLLMDRNRHAEAVELMRGAVRRRSRRAAYRIWLGDALAGAGDAAGARRAWQEALELDPDSRQAQRRLGR
jgi:DNA-binding response OmpR family regulator